MPVRRSTVLLRIRRSTRWQSASTASVHRRRRREMCTVVPAAAASSRMPMMLLPSIVLPSRLHANLRLIARRRVDELRGGAGVQSRAGCEITHPGASCLLRLPRRDVPGVEPSSRSDATQMALRPCSRSCRATSVERGAVLRLAALISIGRFTPVTISILSLVEERDAEIRRRAAEHVGGDQHAARLLSPARSRRRSRRARPARPRASRSTPQRNSAGRRRWSPRR